MQAVDAQVVDELRNFLFGDPNAGGLDFGGSLIFSVGGITVYLRTMILVKPMVLGERLIGLI